MPLRIEGDEVIFSSGRRAEAWSGIIGLSTDLDVSSGADNGFPWPPESYARAQLTADDMRELADFMIAQWTRFKETVDVHEGVTADVSDALTQAFDGLSGDAKTG